jgi:23S rRNA (pseudouridine1915-N3)-methyltransferase
VRIKLLAAGTKLPGWVDAGVEDYRVRLPPELNFELIEVPLQPLDRFEQRYLSQIPNSWRLVALEVTGKPWSSEQLAKELERWMMDGRDVALAIGGPDGNPPAVQARAEQRWSLGPLTLPHAIARLVVTEQLYRAWSILKGHPYHRG